MLMPNLNAFAVAVDDLLKLRADQQRREVRTFKKGLAAAAELVGLRQADYTFAALVGALQEAAARLGDPNARKTLESLGGAGIAANAPTERDVVLPAQQPEFAKGPKKRKAIVVDAQNFPVEAADASVPIEVASAPEGSEDTTVENASPAQPPSSAADEGDVVRGAAQDGGDEPAAANSTGAEVSAEPPRFAVRSVRRPAPRNFAADEQAERLSEEDAAGQDRITTEGNPNSAPSEDGQWTLEHSDTR
jgi:hypothetical protein